VLQRAAGPVGAAVVTVLALMVGLAFTTGRLYLELLQAFLHWIPERLRRAREVSEERRQRKVETAEEKKAAKERLAAEKKKEARRRDLIQERLREQAPTPPEPEPERPAPTPGPKPEPKPKPKPRKAKKPAARAAKPGGTYQFPPVDLLDRPARTDLKKEEGAIQENARTLEATLREFKIEAEVVDFQRGPVVTMYELDIAKGVKVKKLVSYADDIAMALAAQSVRVVAPIPGKSTAGVEVPNRTRDAVRLRALLDHPDYKAKKKQAVPMLLGMDVTGSAIVPDLESMPHLLIAGSTGSGKSVCINAIILSVLYTRTPEEVRLILVDPKQVELSFFADVPHLLTPVVTDMRRAPAILEWAVEEDGGALPAPRAHEGPEHRQLQPDRQDEARRAPRGARGRRGGGAGPALPDRHRHRRAGGPDVHGPEGDRGVHHAPGAEVPRRGHPRDPGHAAPPGAGRDRAHQGQHADAHRVQGDQQPRQPRDHGSRGSGAAPRRRRHAVPAAPGPPRWCARRARSSPTTRCAGWSTG
jgi:hypothetical protein